MSDNLLNLNETSIKFLSNHQVEVKFIHDNEISIKYITFEELALSILASREDDIVGCAIRQTPIFPGTKEVSVIQHKELSNGSEIFILLRQESLFDIKYFDTQYKDVGIPKLIFIIKILRNVIQCVNVFAVKDYIITQDSIIYSFPFSNVDRNTGAVCFGMNRLSSFNVEDATMLHSFPNAFLSMTSNNDSYGGNLSGLEHRPLLEALQGKPFNNDWLLSINKTFKQISN